MHRSKIIITLGILVALLPVFGFPRSWESVFQVLAGLSIAGISVWAMIDKRLTLKNKARLRQAEKKREMELEARSEVERPLTPNTDF